MELLLLLMGLLSIVDGVSFYIYVTSICAQVTECAVYLTLAHACLLYGVIALGVGVT